MVDLGRAAHHGDAAGEAVAPVLQVAWPCGPRPWPGRWCRWRRGCAPRPSWERRTGRTGRRRACPASRRTGTSPGLPGLFRSSGVTPASANACSIELHVVVGMAHRGAACVRAGARAAVRAASFRFLADSTRLHLPSYSSTSLGARRALADHGLARRGHERLFAHHHLGPRPRHHDFGLGLVQSEANSSSCSTFPAWSRTVRNTEMLPAVHACDLHVASAPSAMDSSHSTLVLWASPSCPVPRLRADDVTRIHAIQCNG